MTKKIFLIVISFLILSSCGYEPIYSKKNLNFSIGNIEKTNTSLLTNIGSYLSNMFSSKKKDLEPQESNEIHNIDDGLLKYIHHR